MRLTFANAVLYGCLALTGIVILAVPLLVGGTTVWLGIDWVDGVRLFGIDDAYRFFAATNAFRLESVFLWNYTLPVALAVDASLARLLGGELLPMRVAHACFGVATLFVIARASIRAGCGAYLASASVLIAGLMPIYVILASSFYAEGLAAFMVALAFLFLITDRHTALAVTISLLPLVRAEGAIFVALFLVWFGLRRDFRHCAIVALPGLVYLGSLALLANDGVSALTWRLELRKILAPLDEGIDVALTPDRLPNLLWMSLAIAPIGMARWRRWWPMLAAPVCLVAIQLVSIARGLQGFELRYMATAIPVFAIAWALPIRSLLDRYADNTVRHHAVAAIAAVTALFAIATHTLQSDWVRAAVAGESLRAEASRDINRRTLLFDPEPLIAFAARSDRLISSNEAVATVFVSDWAPLYFLDFLRDRPDIDVVLIPHNATVAGFSDGYFFGFSLRSLDYLYYRFQPRTGADAEAVLIIREAGPDPFNFETPGETKADGPVNVAANVQSGQLKAYTVGFSTRVSVTWDLSRP